MSVTCHICNQKFAKQITNSHLKKHSMTTTDYKEQFGQDSLSCPEYRAEKKEKLSGKNNPNYGKTHSEKTKQAISDKNKGRAAHNKGKQMSDAQKQTLSKKAKERFNNGFTSWNTGKEWSDDVKEKISNSVSEYAKNNTSELKERARKAVNTKVANGYDFGAPMRGKTHTDESKQKILSATEETRKQSKLETFNKILSTIQDSNYKLHNNKDNYYITVECPSCSSIFETTVQYFQPSKFQNRTECPHCNPYKSNGELEVLQLVKDLLPDRTIFSGYKSKDAIWPYELDIYIPELNIAIEYCGLYWHRDDGIKDKKYHLNKLKLCQEKDIQLITIFEDEWINNKEKVINILKVKFGIIQRIYGRKTIIKQIDNKTANAFVKKYHIHSTGRTNIGFGLYSDGELISVMTFNNSNISRKGNEWEINRFCSKNNISVIGGANKLFNAFLTEINPSKVISYSDKRYGEGNIYSLLGFERQDDTPVNYWYWKNDGLFNRFHRYSLRKETHHPKVLTEWEVRHQEGWERIFDCGNAKYIWERKKSEA